jgi:biopolymer transport protein ExbD
VKTPVLDCAVERKIHRHGTLFMAQVSNVSGHARAGFHFRFGLTRGIQMAFSSAGGGPFSTGPKMNVTPLIDVLLVLIIVFMLVVIEQKPVGLQTEIPQQPMSIGPTIPPPQTTIVIQIHHAKPGVERTQVMVNEEKVDWDHLRERLRDIFAIRVERIAYLEADDDIDFQDVADVIAIARIAGVDRVGLLTEDGKHVPMGS